MNKIQILKLRNTFISRSFAYYIGDIIIVCDGKIIFSPDNFITASVLDFNSVDIDLIRENSNEVKL